MKALKKSKKPQPYDEMINEVRVKESVPLNRSLLARMAIEEFIGKRTKPNGQIDLKAVVQPYEKIKAARLAETKTARLEKREARLKEKLAAIAKELGRK